MRFKLPCKSYRLAWEEQRRLSLATNKEEKLWAVWQQQQQQTLQALHTATVARRIEPQPVTIGKEAFIHQESPRNDVLQKKCIQHFWSPVERTRHLLHHLSVLQTPKIQPKSYWSAIFYWANCVFVWNFFAFTKLWSKVKVNVFSTERTGDMWTRAVTYASRTTFSFFTKLWSAVKTGAKCKNSSSTVVCYPPPPTHTQQGHLSVLRSSAHAQGWGCPCLPRQQRRHDDSHKPLHSAQKHNDQSKCANIPEAVKSEHSSCFFSCRHRLHWRRIIYVKVPSVTSGRLHRKYATWAPRSGNNLQEMADTNRLSVFLVNPKQTSQGTNTCFCFCYHAQQQGLHLWSQCCQISFVFQNKGRKKSIHPKAKNTFLTPRNRKTTLKDLCVLCIPSTFDLWFLTTSYRDYI